MDQLRQIEGKEVVPSEKILAKQKLPELLIDLKTAIEMKRIKDTNERKRLVLPSPITRLAANENAYTRESRKEMYLEIAQQKEEEEKRKHPENYVEKVGFGSPNQRANPAFALESEFYTLSKWRSSTVQ